MKHIAKVYRGKAALAVCSAVNGILPVMHYYQDGALTLKPWACCMGGKAFKRDRLAMFAVIAAWKFESGLSLKIKCACIASLLHMFYLSD